ncbi:MAG: dihydrodipicolinate synthase family protein [Gammaproteobacteria bacterium]|nr:dihydrodipicolinate synthase family protein [Gammaproteobacteria bacterium]MDE0365291.1 dihydrodipicolinate synthase family protein [Gammaproteobacteria bacterium]
MAHQDWGGVFPALMTEMNKDGSLDLEGTSRHIELCIQAGVGGFVMLGTLGENNSLLAWEKEAVMRAAVEAVNGRVPVITGIAEYSGDMAIASVRLAEQAGCDGLMALPSMVYQQDSREAMAHFRAIAGATDLPIMIYNNPVSYKVDLSPEDFVELADVDNIVAVKESSHDSRRMTDMVNACGNRYRLFCGVDDVILENVVCGAVGWVAGLTNPFPNESVQLFDAARAGRIDEAVALYRWLMPVLHLDTSVKLVQYLKLANQITGTGAEWVRPPRMPLVGEERARVESIVLRALDNRPALAA